MTSYILRAFWNLPLRTNAITVSGTWPIIRSLLRIRSGMGAYAGAARRRVHLPTVLLLPPSGHRPDRRQVRYARILQIGFHLTQTWCLWTPPRHGQPPRISAGKNPIGDPPRGLRFSSTVRVYKTGSRERPASERPEPSSFCTRIGSATYFRPANSSRSSLVPVVDRLHWSGEFRTTLRSPTSPTFSSVHGPCKCWSVSGQEHIPDAPHYYRQMDSVPRVVVIARL